MSFLRRWFTSWTDSTGDRRHQVDLEDSATLAPADCANPLERLETGSLGEMPATPGPGERVSRMLFHASSFTASTRRVDFRAFEPPRKGEHTQELSVSRTEGLAEADVWLHADLFVGSEVIARADFRLEAINATAVNEFRLRLVPSEPPPRHANIEGWPPVENGEIRKQLAQQLRLNASPVVVVRP